MFPAASISDIVSFPIASPEALTASKRKLPINCPTWTIDIAILLTVSLNSFDVLTLLSAICSSKIRI